MSNLADLLWKLEKQSLAEEGFQRAVITGVFIEQRDRLIAAYAALMRLHYEIDRRNAALQGIPNAKPFTHPVGTEARDWCNAAIHILTVADEATQRYFLAADRALKAKLVQAVIDDDGAENLAGVWIELPS